jgi:hypothetical protein
MKVLAHIREQYSLSLGSYGRPRMTMELKEVGLDVGERRVGRHHLVSGPQKAGFTWLSSSTCPSTARLRQALRINCADVSWAEQPKVPAGRRTVGKAAEGGLSATG